MTNLFTDRRVNHIGFWLDASTGLHSVEVAVNGRNAAMSGFYSWAEAYGWAKVRANQMLVA